MSPWQDKDAPLVLIVGAVLISTVVLGVLAFAPLDYFSKENDWSFAEASQLDSLEISLEAAVCDVELSFADLSGSLVQVQMNVEGRSGLLSGVPDIAYSLTPVLQGSDLELSIVLMMDTGPTVRYERSTIAVTVDRSIPASLDIDVDVGDVVVTVPGNASITRAAVHTDVGGAYLHLDEGAMVMGDVRLRADVGSVNIDISSVLFADEVSLQAETGTGSIFLDVMLPETPGGNVTFDCLANVGSVHLNLLVQGATSAEITSQTNVGKVQRTTIGFSGMDTHLKSVNHPGIWNLDFRLRAEVGSVDIEAEWRE